MTKWLAMLMACLALGLVVAGCGDDDDDDGGNGGADTAESGGPPPQAGGKEEDKAVRRGRDRRGVDEGHRVRSRPRSP